MLSLQKFWYYSFIISYYLWLCRNIKLLALQINNDVHLDNYKFNCLSKARKLHWSLLSNQILTLQKFRTNRSQDNWESFFLSSGEVNFELDISQTSACTWGDATILVESYLVEKFNLLKMLKMFISSILSLQLIDPRITAVTSWTNNTYACIFSPSLSVWNTRLIKLITIRIVRWKHQDAKRLLRDPISFITGADCFHARRERSIIRKIWARFIQREHLRYVLKVIRFCRTVEIRLTLCVSFGSVVYCIKHVRLVGVLTS